MAFIAKLATILRKIGAVVDRELPLQLKLPCLFGRHASTTAKEISPSQRATTIKSPYLIILIASLSLFAFVGFMIARRNNRRLLNNENIEGEQPNEEQLMPIRNAADQANQGNVEIVELEQIPHEIEPNSRRRHCLNTLEAKLNFGTRLAIVNLLVELPSAVFDQISSENKPAYVLIVMLLSLTSMLVSLTELVYKGIKERIAWRWRGGSLPWFYYPPPRINRRFATLTEMIGLSCGIAQFIFTSINYYYCIQDHSTPIKICVWPTIVAFAIVCSRFMTNPNENGEEETSADDVVS